MEDLLAHGDEVRTFTAKDAESAKIEGRQEGVAVKKSILILLTIVVLGSAQPKNDPRPDFKDCLAEKIYAGAAAAPKLSKADRMFRTRIREGAKSKVQFAGHYTVPRWGCGSGCSTFMIVDSITGTVYDGFSVADLPPAWTQKHEGQEQMEFRPNSRLMKINGCPGEQNCGFYDYEMVEGQGLKLVRKELLPKEFQ